MWRLPNYRFRPITSIMLHWSLTYVAPKPRRTGNVTKCCITLPLAEQQRLARLAEQEAFSNLPRDIAKRLRSRGGPVWQASLCAALLKLLGAKASLIAE